MIVIKREKEEQYKPVPTNWGFRVVLGETRKQIRYRFDEAQTKLLKIEVSKKVNSAG